MIKIVLGLSVCIFISSILFVVVFYNNDGISDGLEQQKNLGILGGIVGLIIYFIYIVIKFS